MQSAVQCNAIRTIYSTVGVLACRFSTAAAAAGEPCGLPARGITHNPRDPHAHLLMLKPVQECIHGGVRVLIQLLLPLEPKFW